MASAAETKATERAGEVNIQVTDTSAGSSTKSTIDQGASQLVEKENNRPAATAPIWNSLKPGPAFTGTLTPGATTPGASTPGIFSFDEPFGEVAKTSLDPAALRAKIDHVHDGGLEGGFHHGDDDEHEDGHEKKHE